MPSVSVMTVAYDTPAEILRECWVSLCAQTATDWEMVLVDDASTRADTLGEIEKISADPRVRFAKLPQNVGAGGARQVALELCAADLVAILDSDDVALPSWLARQVAYMADHPEVTVCGSAIEAFRGRQTLRRIGHPAVITDEVIARQAARGRIWFLNNPGAIYRRRPIVELGGYNPALRRGQDYDLWIRCFRAGLTLHNQPDVLMRYRRP